MNKKLLIGLTLGAALFLAPAEAAVIDHSIGTNYTYAQEEGTKTVAVFGEVATPAYWLNKTQDAVILDDEKRAMFNDLIEGGFKVYDLNAVPATFTAAEVKAIIDEASEGFLKIPPIRKIYQGEALTDDKWQKLYANTQLTADSYQTRLAVTTERTILKVLPIAEGIFDDESEIKTKYDIMQGTVLNPGEAVAVVAKSADGEFALVFSTTYIGWVPNTALGYTDDREVWQNFYQPTEYATVVAPIIKFANRNHGLIYQMGAKLPVVTKGGIDHDQLPQRAPDGSLAVFNGDLEAGLRAGVEVKGELAFTRHNVIREAFKYLGEDYGWGGTDYGVDGSGLVQNVYRALGVNLPRNADDQQNAFMGVTNTLPLENMDEKDKLAILQNAPAGTLLFTANHSMIWLGFDESKRPLVLHALSAAQVDGEKVYQRQVIVSSLNAISTNGKSFLDNLTVMGQF